MTIHCLHDLEDRFLDGFDASRLALAELAGILSKAAVAGWDGPDDGSGTLVLELSSELEISIHDLGQGLQVDACIVAPVESLTSRRICTVVDERIPDGSFAPKTPDEAFAFVRSLVDEWIALAAAAVRDDAKRELDADADRGPPIRDAARSACADFVAACACAGLFDLDDAADAMVAVTHPTSRSLARIEATIDGDQEWTLDGRSLTWACRNLPEAVHLKVESANPPNLRVRPHSWRPVWRDPPETVDLLRRMAAIGAAPRLERY